MVISLCSDAMKFGGRQEKMDRFGKTLRNKYLLWLRVRILRGLGCLKTIDEMADM